jgi:hypothetical protein
MTRFPYTRSALSSLLLSLGDVVRPHKSDGELHHGHGHGHVGGTCLAFLNDGLAGRPVPLVTLTALIEVRLLSV